MQKKKKGAPDPPSDGKLGDQRLHLPKSHFDQVGGHRFENSIFESFESFIRLGNLFLKVTFSSINMFLAF